MMSRCCSGERRGPTAPPPFLFTAVLLTSSTNNFKKHCMPENFCRIVLMLTESSNFFFISRSFCNSSHHYQLGSSNSDRENVCKFSSPLIDDDSINARLAIDIQQILRIHNDDSEIEKVLDRCKFLLSEDLVVKVLHRHRSDWKPAYSFFNWAAKQHGYCHGSEAYNEMLDILGRMKNIKVMKQLFDEIPRGRDNIINDRTFAILMNRCAAAHKVEEAIAIFYKRKDYGLELDMAAFQTLLISLCRYKHVEEAEALFLKKQHEFPPVVKSRNIILNGWCVRGNLLEAKRFWNEIVSSSYKPDLYTYSIFINSLTKAGKLATAIKLFTSMMEKGYHPDVSICNCIIDALCFKKRIPEALEIFGEMNERGCLPDVATYNSLIKHLCKIRRMEKVYELLDEMEQKGCLPNSRTYTYILKISKDPQEVANLLGRMKSTGSKIDGDTFNLILNLYVCWNYEMGIKSIWNQMEKCGVGPDQRSYTIHIHGLYSQGKFDEALEYYSQMKDKGMIPEPRTRLLVKAIHLNREGRDKASKSSTANGKMKTGKHPLR